MQQISETEKIVDEAMREYRRQNIDKPIDRLYSRMFFAAVEKVISYDPPKQNEYWLALDYEENGKETVCFITETLAPWAMNFHSNGIYKLTNYKLLFRICKGNEWDWNLYKSTRSVVHKDYSKAYKYKTILEYISNMEIGQNVYFKIDPKFSIIEEKQSHREYIIRDARAFRKTLSLFAKSRKFMLHSRILKEDGENRLRIWRLG